MKHMNCPQEAAIAKAVRTGNLGKFLTGHVATCAMCSETLQTSSWMQSLAGGPEKNPALPHASLLWWRVRLSEKQLETEKAQDFFEWVEIVSVAVISLGLAASVTWNWFTIQGWVASILEGAQPWLTLFCCRLFSCQSLLFCAWLLLSWVTQSSSITDGNRYFEVVLHFPGYRVRARETKLAKVCECQEEAWLEIMRSSAW